MSDTGIVRELGGVASEQRGWVLGPALVRTAEQCVPVLVFVPGPPLRSERAERPGSDFASDSAQQQSMHCVLG